jgi:fatty acid desaturase
MTYRSRLILSAFASILMAACLAGAATFMLPWLLLPAVLLFGLMMTLAWSEPVDETLARWRRTRRFEPKPAKPVQQTEEETYWIPVGTFVSSGPSRSRK